MNAYQTLTLKNVNQGGNKFIKEEGVSVTYKAVVTKSSSDVMFFTETTVEQGMATLTFISESKITTLTWVSGIDVGKVPIVNKLGDGEISVFSTLFGLRDFGVLGARV